MKAFSHVSHITAHPFPKKITIFKEKFTIFLNTNFFLYVLTAPNYLDCLFPHTNIQTPFTCKNIKKQYFSITSNKNTVKTTASLVPQKNISYTIFLINCF